MCKTCPLPSNCAVLPQQQEKVIFTDGNGDEATFYVDSCTWGDDEGKKKKGKKSVTRGLLNAVKKRLLSQRGRKKKQDSVSDVVSTFPMCYTDSTPHCRMCNEASMMGEPCWDTTRDGSICCTCMISF